MGYYCTVPQCTSLAGKTKNVKFHRFPRDENMADKWNLILKRGKPYTKYSKVCSLHFTQADYNVTTMGKTKGQWKTLSKDAVPSQNLPKLNADGTVMVIRKSRTVKYRESKKDDIIDKSDKWSLPHHHHALTQDAAVNSGEMADVNLAYRLQTLSAIAHTISPQQPPMPHNAPHHPKPKKQDAIMQTDPVQSEEDDTQGFEDKPLEVDYQNYKEQSQYAKDTYQKDAFPKDTYQKDPFPKDTYQKDPFPKDTYQKDAFPKDTFHKDTEKYDTPKDYTKTEDDYIPQTNEEYNNEAEKYALERKSHNGYEKPLESYPKSMESYPKMDLYPTFSDKGYSNRPDAWYQNGYPDSVDILRNQQQNLQMLQEQHRVTENQNFFNENHIKQEIDINVEEDKFLYERTKDQLDANSLYASRRLREARIAEHLTHHVKQEPEAGCDNVMQPQGSPYFPSNGHNNVTGGYYGEARLGPELLIAKQNALAAHPQLWQNTMKRPFFYSESPHYNSPHLLQRYEDISRILQ
ncbi:uncharacterized protein LOC114365069 isoform X3 [Ostrinia furnacalis]|uniref:uncharacterized protein LOC114365069 isoform X3 n=1 Tax=Ostrinia furnacalis TaxID=93504 RepID=UPI00103898E9|nr:uncharacterized protein LOC114365069 isoform X3 [Ostrinia furnacalis]